VQAAHRFPISDDAGHAPRPLAVGWYSAQSMVRFARPVNANVKISKVEANIDQNA
jgi:hypothetical protein